MNNIQSVNEIICPNNCQELHPRWNGSDGVDDESKAIGFICHRCHREFSPLAAKNHLVQFMQTRPAPANTPDPENTLESETTPELETSD